jgi:hypothetical protein
MVPLDADTADTELLVDADVVDDSDTDEDSDADEEAGAEDEAGAEEEAGTEDDTGAEDDAGAEDDSHGPVGKKLPRRIVPACTSTCTKQSPSAAASSANRTLLPKSGPIE